MKSFLKMFKDIRFVFFVIFIAAMIGIFITLIIKNVNYNKEHQRVYPVNADSITIVETDSIMLD